MKKLLRTALSAALIFSNWPANAADLFKNLKVNGGLDLQSYTSRNVTDFTTHGAFNDRRGGTNTRVWLGMGWDLLDDVHARATVRKTDRSWGDPGGSGQNGTTGQANSQPLFSGGGNGVANRVYVDEANFKIDKVFGRFDSTFGRQYYGDPGDLIIYYGPTSTIGFYSSSIDALRVDTANDWVMFSGIAGKTSGQPVTAAGTNADVDVRGFNVGVKNLPVKTNVFVWNQVSHGIGNLGTPPNPAAASGVNDNLWVYGLKLKGEAMGGWLSATVASNAGSNRTGLTAAAAAAPTANSSNYIGKALLVDAGYKADINGVGGFTPWLNFGWGTGRSSTIEGRNEGFTSINSDYRPGVIYGRFSGAGPLGATSSVAMLAPGGVVANSPGLNNKVIWGVGLKANPAALNKLTAGLSYWDFRFQRATSGTFVGGPPALGNKHIGSELDLQFDWKHSDNVMFDVGMAHFMPGGFVNESLQTGNAVATGSTAGSGRGVNPACMAFADVNIKF
ncbi:MAG: hypothetical protein HY078_15200 [Elusimicrobia bacterium]|nr:hypothetical protein [Elusimicrobiota bacterium]